ncbi:hypothetical protein [Aquincola sp. J276]|uniref:hypothetical protein n=1 Tax=Aquincola sp. J276 TaxID=2898432 RepID=UPI002151D592|nr:hypothetical protein [Aquincola sp. J276]MCR5868226.1 hypothetical protein [Aquincola sp. J276]
MNLPLGFRCRAMVAACALLLAACTSVPGLRPLTYASPGEARVFASAQQCPHEPLVQPEAAPLIAAILTGAASQLLSNFGTALSEGAKGGNLPSSVATLNMSLQPDAVPRCLLIVRGSFAPSADNPRGMDLGPKFNLPPGNEQAKTTFKERLVAFNLPTVYRLDHMVELRIVVAPNNRALAVAPLFVRIDRSLDESEKGPRDLSVSVKFQRIGATAEAGGVVLIPDQTIGSPAPALEENPTTKRYPRESPWFGSFHAAPAPATSSGPPATKALVTVFDTDASAVPVTVTTTVVETRPTREGLAFIASVFGSAKPRIEEALKPILNPAFKAEEDIKEQTAELNGDAEHETAVTAAKLAVLAYCSSKAGDDAAAKQDRLTKSSAARVAQLKANASAVKYGKADMPFKVYVAVSDGPVPTTCP